MRGVVLAVFATACGRIGFDAGALGDAPRGDGLVGDGTIVVDVVLANHDDDGDGLDDAIDPCPHLPGTADDSDGDGVGDACDPSAGMERIALFDPFTSLDPSVELEPGWQLGTDELVFNTTGFRAVNRTFAITNADIWIGMTIDSLVTPPNHQIIIHASTGTEQPRYFGQLYRTTGQNEQGIVSYDDVSFQNIDSTPLGASGIPVGDLTLLLSVRVTDHRATWTTTFGGVTYETNGMIAGYDGSPRVRFAMTGMTGRLRYTCIITPQ